MLLGPIGLFGLLILGVNVQHVKGPINILLYLDIGLLQFDITLAGLQHFFFGIIFGQISKKVLVALVPQIVVDKPSPKPVIEYLLGPIVLK